MAKRSPHRAYSLHATGHTSCPTRPYGLFISSMYYLYCNLLRQSQARISPADMSAVVQVHGLLCTVGEEDLQGFHRLVQGFVQGRRFVFPEP